MRTANVAELKKHLSAYLEMAERGEEVQICRRNVPIAVLRGIEKQGVNKTVLGCGEGTVTYRADVTEPFMPPEEWDMHDEGEAGDGRPA